MEKAENADILDVFMQHVYHNTTVPKQKYTRPDCFVSSLTHTSTHSDMTAVAGKRKKQLCCIFVLLFVLSKHFFLWNCGGID